MQANSRSTNSSSVANQQLYNVNSQPEKQLARDNLSLRASFRHRSFDNDLGFVSRTFRPPLGAVFIFQKQSLEKGWPGPSSLRDGPLFFLTGGGGVENFRMQTFFYMRLLLKTIFFVFVLKQTLFVHAYNLFQCLQPLQTIYFNPNRITSDNHPR